MQGLDSSYGGGRVSPHCSANGQGRLCTIGHGLSHLGVEFLLEVCLVALRRSLDTLVSRVPVGGADLKND
jgi:hypothetical protein